MQPTFLISCVVKFLTFIFQMQPLYFYDILYKPIIYEPCPFQTRLSHFYFLSEEQQPFPQKKPNQDISVLPIDSIYTPVRKVNYTVEITRVGQMIDFDKLVIEVWTDGSLKADEALSLAAKVMTEHLALFIDLSEATKNILVDSFNFTVSSAESIPKIEDKPCEIISLSLSISSLMYFTTLHRTS